MPSDSIPTIGRSNKLIARIRRLARSPDERANAGLLLAEGVRLAEVALDEGATITQAVVSERLEREPRGRRLLRRLTASGVHVSRSTDSLMSSLHDAGSHQGVLLLAERLEGQAVDFIASGDRTATWLAACGVQDPGNMGALVRVADAAGATGFIAARGADPWGPKAVRASAGSIFRIPIMTAASWSVLTRQIAEMKKQGAVMAGAVASGGADYASGFPGCPVVLFMGSEGAGLPQQIEKIIEHSVTIPLQPGVESINVASAAAVLMFERRRQLALQR